MNVPNTGLFRRVPDRLVHGAIAIALWLLLVVVLGSLFGCARVATDPLPPGAERFTPPERWAALRDSIARCSGAAPSRDVEWWLVPDGALGPQVMGRWDAPHRIALTEFVVTREVRTTILHELLHDALRSGAHPPVFEACGLTI